MSSRKRGQAGREGPRGRESKMGIIHVIILIVTSNTIYRFETADKRDEWDHGDRIKNRNNFCYNKKCSINMKVRRQAGQEGPRGRE